MRDAARLERAFAGVTVESHASTIGPPTLEFARRLTGRLEVAMGLETIHPQSWDVPMDYVVTERGIYRRDPEGLVFLAAPEPGGSGVASSPVCYADEDYFKGRSGVNDR